MCVVVGVRLWIFPLCTRARASSEHSNVFGRVTNLCVGGVVSDQTSVDALRQLCLDLRATSTLRRLTVDKSTLLPELDAVFQTLLAESLRVNTSVTSLSLACALRCVARACAVAVLVALSTLFFVTCLVRSFHAGAVQALANMISLNWTLEKLVLCSPG